MIIIRSILTVFCDTMLAYVIVAGHATSLALHLKTSILISNTLWHCTNWWPMGAFSPSEKISNATLTFSSYCICPQSIVIHGIQGKSLLHSLREFYVNFWLFLNI